MAEILEKVKTALGITGNYQDSTLQVYIDEIQGYMIDAGIPKPIAHSVLSAGLIARGVTDLWNYGSTAGKLSEYFYQRLSQLVYAFKCGKIIHFAEGDYGGSFPVVFEGVEIERGDKVIFTCGDLSKTYENLQCDGVLLSFTKEESEKLKKGTYKWDMKIEKYYAVVTVVNDGWLVVW